MWGGDASCEHEWGTIIPPRGKSNWDSFDAYRNETDRGHGGYSAAKPSGSKTGTIDPSTKAKGQGSFCLRCHAWRGSLGLEPTPDCGRPFVELRDDLTEKEQAYVLSELEKLNLME